jgi:phospholipase/carboxylesterase
MADSGTTPPAAELESQTIGPAANAAGSIVWLHGMGQAGPAMHEVACAAGLDLLPVRQVFPTAPYRDVGVVRSGPIRSWLVQTVSKLETADPLEAGAAIAAVRSVIRREADVVGAGRVVLVGFSQGAAMTLMTGLTYPDRLAGLAVYAPSLPLARHSDKSRFKANARNHIWIGHGEHDDVIPMARGTEIRDGLLRNGYDVRWHSYPNGHDAFGGAAGDLRYFVTEILGLPS